MQDIDEIHAFYFRFMGILDNEQKKTCRKITADPFPMRNRFPQLLLSNSNYHWQGSKSVALSFVAISVLR